MGIESILLKGPALQHWLYPHEFRVYGDIDLLVHPENRQTALALLAGEGYLDPYPGMSSSETAMHARTLVGPDGATVDLHTRLNNTGVSESKVWDVLWPQTRQGWMAGQQVRMLQPAAQLLVVTLHAAQHGCLESKPLEDVRRASHLVSDEDIALAVMLADDLGAAESFSAGVEMVPELQARLPQLAPVGLSPLVKISAASLHSQPGLLLFFGLRTQSWPNRMKTLMRAVWPSADFLRSRVGAAAYALPGWERRARLHRLAYQVRHGRRAAAAIYKMQRGAY